MKTSPDEELQQDEANWKKFLALLGKKRRKRHGHHIRPSDTHSSDNRHSHGK